MKHILLLFATIVLALPTLSARDKRGYIIVTDHIKAKEWRSGDVSDALQRIIDENPNRVIFFPDGEYIISKPLLTPADPEKSVSLELSAYAVIRAAEGWSHNEAMIRLGGKCKANNITKPGSNYYLAGGIIDCMGVAKGISIESGRETAVRNCSIKNARLGLHIKHGANSGSSDCDISGVNIVGCKDEMPLECWSRDMTTPLPICVSAVYIRALSSSPAPTVCAIFTPYITAKIQDTKQVAALLTREETTSTTSATATSLPPHSALKIISLAPTPTASHIGTRSLS